jgi:hypothetical protein
MKTYKNEITLIRNSRGCYILDTVKGCPAGAMYDGRGCYADCYAKNIARRYGFDFEEIRLREFSNDKSQLWLFGFSDKSHTEKIIREIRAADMPFIRIGEMGDPSLAWEHTLKVCHEISPTGKDIVIITKHWKKIPDELLDSVASLPLCVNTSVSALDDERLIDVRLEQYERLKKVCKSVLRIVSCDFNTDHADGLDRSIVQKELFKLANGNCIDTVFRPRADNPFVLKNIIKTKKVKFGGSVGLASIYNQKTYFGSCGTCPELCGVAMARVNGEKVNVFDESRLLQAG